MYKLSEIGDSEPAFSPLRKDGASPLHRQISDELRRQIAARELQPGDLLPSEHTLMKRFGVSRGTVRQALAALRADGAISGSQGRQLAVRGSRLTQPLSELISFSVWVRSLGKRPSGLVIETGSRPADEDMAAALDVELGAEVLYLMRLRLADDEPLMIERTSFPAKVGKLLRGVDLERQSIYAELAQQGIVFASARHLIGAVSASPLDAELLQVDPGTPLVRVHRHAFSLSGEPLEWSDDRYVARVQFGIENTATGAGFIRQLE